MGENVTKEDLKELCDLRHKPLEGYFKKIDNKFDILFGRIWWIYLFIILSLGGIVTNIIQNKLNGKEPNIIVNIDESIIRKK